MCSKPAGQVAEGQVECLEAKAAPGDKEHCQHIPACHHCSIEGRRNERHLEVCWSGHLYVYSGSVEVDETCSILQGRGANIYKRQEWHCIASRIQAQPDEACTKKAKTKNLARQCGLLCHKVVTISPCIRARARAGMLLMAAL